jgi:hypothetical protein
MQQCSSLASRRTLRRVLQGSIYQGSGYWVLGTGTMATTLFGPLMHGLFLHGILLTDNTADEIVLKRRLTAALTAQARQSDSHRHRPRSTVTSNSKQPNNQAANSQQSTTTGGLLKHDVLTA